MHNFGAVSATTAREVCDLIDALGGKRIDPMPDYTDQQRGPTCGLYALSFVLQYWDARRFAEGKPLAKAPLPARKADLGIAKDPSRVKDPSNPASLREIAKGMTTPSGKPITYLGEIFSGDAMAAVARSAGFQATVHKEDTTTYLDTIYKLLDRGIPPIVGVDVDADATKPGGGGVNLSNANYACPGTFGGNNAHWVTLVGYCDSRYGRLLFQMNWGSYYFFKADGLKQSSNQLVKFADPESQVWEKAVPGPGVTVPLDQRGDLWSNAMPARRRDLLRLSNSTWSASYNRTTRLGHALRFETTSPKKGKTLTTIFPDVLLDLKNQVVEVTPP